MQFMTQTAALKLVTGFLLVCVVWNNVGESVFWSESSVDGTGQILAVRVVEVALSSVENVGGGRHIKVTVIQRLRFPVVRNGVLCKRAIKSSISSIFGAGSESLPGKVCFSFYLTFSSTTSTRSPRSDISLRFRENGFHLRIFPFG